MARTHVLLHEVVGIVGDHLVIPYAPADEVEFASPFAEQFAGAFVANLTAELDLSDKGIGSELCADTYLIQVLYRLGEVAFLAPGLGEKKQRVMRLRTQGLRAVAPNASAGASEPSSRSSKK